MTPEQLEYYAARGSGHMGTEANRCEAQVKIIGNYL